MTNERALRAQFSKLTSIRPDSIQFHLAKQSLDAAAEYLPSNEKQLDMAVAGLLFILCTSPKSISELDFSITKQEAREMADLRASLYRKWGEVDPMAPVEKRATITGRRPW